MEQEFNTRLSISCYRQILKEELSLRCKHNSHYSLRAFARDLEVAPSRLSEVLNGKQGLSRKAATAIADKLDFNLEEQEYFCDLVTSIHSRSKDEREAAQARVEQARKEFDEDHHFKLETFKVLSEWYHGAIFEMCKMDDFKFDKFYIAKKLKISTIQVELAVERLVRLGMLRIDDDMLLSLPSAGIGRPKLSTPPAECIKMAHKQCITKACDALYSQTQEQREMHTNIFAMDKDDLQQAKLEIQTFLRQFIKNRKDLAAKKDEVYCFSLQLFSMLES